jgi:hypothetical protein
MKCCIWFIAYHEPQRWLHFCANLCSFQISLIWQHHMTTVMLQTMYFMHMQICWNIRTHYLISHFNIYWRFNTELNVWLRPSTKLRSVHIWSRETDSLIHVCLFIHVLAKEKKLLGRPHLFEFLSVCSHLIHKSRISMRSGTEFDYKCMSELILSDLCLFDDALNHWNYTAWIDCNLCE